MGGPLSPGGGQPSSPAPASATAPTVAALAELRLGPSGAAAPPNGSAPPQTPTRLGDDPAPPAYRSGSASGGAEEGDDAPGPPLGGSSGGGGGGGGGGGLKLGGSSPFAHANGHSLPAAAAHANGHALPAAAAVPARPFAEALEALLGGGSLRCVLGASPFMGGYGGGPL